ncbi:hypothetical protein FH609_018760 [Streptomyces sp. 3MP-14]|uniref:Uncharacterized protein n=1 Tax=Streptomyces mimosae TaxID=2586635 RepID=A0A5N6A6V1_9ACTN|nr:MULTISPECIES: hypothetical protein [Streptomyces]KAB8163713.1 hypothetical protein FH607_017300 [Streptomyces mimosae]KAB8175156.1 hypothetical protein FH609_018760 [Streptomyces sp. 3MP-14]
MDPPPGTPQPALPPDPLAVGLANASLLGIGYALLRRPWLALGAAAGSVALLGSVVVTGSRWLEALVALWWLACAAHGWHLARSTAKSSAGGGSWRGGDRRLRLQALAVTGPVLLSFAIVRIDAQLIERDAVAAHRDGDCARTLSRLDEYGPFHRLFAAPLTERAERETEACELLLSAEGLADEWQRDAAVRAFAQYAAHPGARWDGAGNRTADLHLALAEDDLDRSLAGETPALASGFDHLATVLDRQPGRAAEVEGVLDGFLDALPADNPCATRAVAGWLGEREPDGSALDRAADVVPTLEPAVSLDCGERLLERSRWEEARDVYRDLVDAHPDHERADEAADGVERAEAGIELVAVRALLEAEPTAGEPRYCDDPAPYRAAPPYRGAGPHPALLLGDEEGTATGGELPDSWLAEGPRDAVLIVCLGTPQMGDAIETCSYESDLGIDGSSAVTFRETRVPLRAFELRTGELVSDRALEIGGASCPDVLTWETFLDYDIPPSEVYAESSPADVRAAYEALITP